MDTITKYFDDAVTKQLVTSLIVILTSMIIYNAINYIFIKGENKLHIRLFTSKRGKTYVKLIRSIIRNLFFIITLLIVLSINGVDVNSALTGVGIFGVIMGFALQDWFKDIIRGASIISDNYFSVGDIIKYHDSIGKVLIIGLKSTRIQDLENDNIITVANRNIEEVEIISKIILIDIPLSYELPLSRAEQVIGLIISEVKQMEHVEDITYVNVSNFNDSSISYRLKILCNPEYRLNTRKLVLRTILDVLEQNNISIPYNQLDIHNK